MRKHAFLCCNLLYYRKGASTLCSTQFCLREREKKVEQRLLLVQWLTKVKFPFRESLKILKS
jgi:hypothetical protein